MANEPVYTKVYYGGQWHQKCVANCWNVGFDLSNEPGSELGARWRLENSNQDANIAAAAIQQKKRETSMANKDLKAFKGSIKDQLAAIKASESKQAYQAAKKESKVMIQTFKAAGYKVPIAHTNSGVIVDYVPNSFDNTTGSANNDVLNPPFTSPPGGLEQSYDDALSRGGPASTADMTNLMSGLDWGGLADDFTSNFFGGGAPSSAQSEIARLTSGESPDSTGQPEQLPQSNNTMLLVLAAAAIGIWYFSQKKSRRTGRG